MAILYVLVGLPASGKSTWAENHKFQLDAEIVSSDTLRKEEYGDEAIQGDNQKLFQTLHRMTRDRLADGKNVIFDATNLSYKHRVSLLQFVSRENPCAVAVVFATQFERCLERNEKRSRTVRESRMWEMYRSIYIPQYFEGWDKIWTIYDYNWEDFNATKIFKELVILEQENPNHTKTVGNHNYAVAGYIHGHFEDEILEMAGLLHDIGKLETKKKENYKGEPTEIAHYYGHESVGAYKALLIAHSYGFTKNDSLRLAGLVNWHMRPHFMKTDKSRNKTLRLVGEDFYSDILKLHEADINSR